MRASAGTLDRLHIVQAVNLGRALDECRKKGFWIYAATLAEKSLPLFQAPLNMPAVIVLGNEDKGVRPKILSRCHALAHVPMPGSLDSLNVAQAGAMFMYELLRRQLADSKK
jgi:23S rRNA (guanosine2251-2'-O)-methyltransferase